MSENQEQTNGQDQENVQPCCEGGSCCPSGSSKGSQRGKMIAFMLIVVAAGAVLANSLVRKSQAVADQSQTAFAAIETDNTDEKVAPTTMETTAAAEPKKMDSDTQKTAPSLWKTELASLSSLNQVAADVDAVFVLLGSSSDRNSKGTAGEMKAALTKIQATGKRVSTFWLKDSSPEYASFSQQVTLPCVFAMVKGGGMSAVSDEISETKLVQAFVTASRPASGCGPSGCGPAGCN